MSKSMTDLAAELRAAADSLEAVALSAPDDSPYKGAYEYRMERRYNGILSDADILNFTRDWVEICHELPVETKEMARKAGNSAGMWTQAGGLEVRSGGRSDKAFSALRRKYYDLAAEIAMRERKAAGWTGDRYLTSPSGKTRGDNGQRFGKFTRPSVLDKLAPYMDD